MYTDVSDEKDDSLTVPKWARQIIKCALIPNLRNLAVPSELVVL